MANRAWYNNGEIELLLNYDEDIPDGFERGRLKWSQERRDARKGAGNPNYGKVDYWTGKKMPPDNRGATLKAQYASGERVVWNKGLTKDTHPSLKKISDERIGQTAHNKGIPMSDEQKEKIKRSQYLTKKKNNSFNKSSAEEELYIQLCAEYGEDDVIRQYKEARYPFACDFYIPSQDLFIEFNGTWTHGVRPYDPNDLDCEDQLNKWRIKAETSKFYRNAIYTWTDLDVRKAQIAKKNKLNYRVIY